MRAKFPIAMVCAQDSSGESWGVALPLWGLLREGHDVATREQLTGALLAAQRISNAGPRGDELAMADADAFVAIGGQQKIVAIECPSSGKEAERVRAMLGAIAQEALPSAPVRLGRGALGELLRSGAFLDSQEMSEHLPKVAAAGMVWAQGAPNLTPKGQWELAEERGRKARSEAKLAELRSKIDAKRSRLPSEDAGGKAPLLVVSSSTNYTSHGVFSAMPMFFGRTMFAELPVEAMGGWEAIRPRDPQGEAALLARAKGLVGEAVAKLDAQGPHAGLFAGMDLDSMQVGCARGRWFVAMRADTRGCLQGQKGQEARFMEEWAEAGLGAVARALGARCSFMAGMAGSPKEDVAMAEAAAFGAEAARIFSDHGEDERLSPSQGELASLASLLCSADMRLEVADPKVSGAKGGPI